MCGTEACERAECYRLVPRSRFGSDLRSWHRLSADYGLPDNVESGWDACVASMARPATQQRIKTLIERGLSKPGDAENRLEISWDSLRAEHL